MSAEVALALIVLVAAGLMIKSLLRLVNVDPGLDPRNVLSLTMALPQPDFYGPPVRSTSAATSRIASARCPASSRSARSAICR